LHPYYAYPYYGAQWFHPMLCYWPPRPNYRNWPPHVQDMIQQVRSEPPIEWRDYGGRPFVVNIEEAAERNVNYRTAIWTGRHLQVTLMSIDVGDDIGLEMHPDVDQFIRIEQGRGYVQMGERQDHLDFARNVFEDDAILIPAGTWHNVTNTGNVPLKLYSIYAPPQHPFGTVQRTKEEAQAAER